MRNWMSFSPCAILLGASSLCAQAPLLPNSAPAQMPSLPPAMPPGYLPTEPSYAPVQMPMAPQVPTTLPTYPRAQPNSLSGLAPLNTPNWQSSNPPASLPLPGSALPQFLPSGRAPASLSLPGSAVIQLPSPNAPSGQQPIGPQAQLSLPLPPGAFPAGGYPVDGVIPTPLSAPDGPFSGHNFWMSGDYMMGWMHGMHLPALATTSPSGTAQTAAGVLGQSGTSTLFGGTVDNGIRSGFRLGMGGWFTPDGIWGVEAGFMMLPSQTSNFAASSAILGRPFVDATTGAPQAVLVAFPGSSTGSISVAAKSGGFYSGNFDLVERTYECDWFRLSTLFGYRYASYGEDLQIHQQISPTSSNFVPGTTIVSNDHFLTRNIFNGADLGLRSEFFWNSLSLELLTKVALGRMNSIVSVDGNQTTTVPGASPVVTRNGVYALGSNIGSFDNNHLRVLPEFGATLKWQVRSYLQLRVGYSFMLLNDVAQAGNQINTTINPANFTQGSGATPNQPTFIFRQSDVWIQSVNFGIVLTF